MKTYTMSDLNALALAREAAYVTFATKRPAGSEQAHSKAHEAYVSACAAYCEQTGANIWDVYRSAGTPLPDAGSGADDETPYAQCMSCYNEARYHGWGAEADGLLEDCKRLREGDPDPTAWTVCPRCETQVPIDDLQPGQLLCDPCAIDTYDGPIPQEDDPNPFVGGVAMFEGGGSHREEDYIAAQRAILQEKRDASEQARLDAQKRPPYYRDDSERRIAERTVQWLTHRIDAYDRALTQPCTACEIAPCVCGFRARAKDSRGRAAINDLYVYQHIDDNARRAQMRSFARASLVALSLLLLGTGGTSAAETITYTSPTSGHTLTLPFIGTPSFSDSCRIVAAWEDRRDIR